MISININEENKLIFKISLSDIRPADLTGFMKIVFEKIEYSIPIKIKNGDIIVNIPILYGSYNKEIKNGSILDARLEIIAGDYYLVPWKDKIKMENADKININVVEKVKYIKPKIEIFI